MASYFIFIAITQALLVQIVYSQCVNRVVPNCQMPIEYLPIEFLPNQLLVNPAGPLTYPVPSYTPSLAASEIAPIVYQDSSVANSLANALQLLVVSNLLGKTLPGVCEPEYYIDPYLPMGSLPPYGYIY